MHIKTVKITNPKNVLVQIPGYVVSQWGAKMNDELEVVFDETSNTLTIRPDVYRREQATKGL